MNNNINWFEDICKWADKYNLSVEIFPRDKTLLENMIELQICNENIKEIPPQIEHLKNLLVIMACNNNIKKLPQEFFNLKSLSMLTFANNNISVIPDEIEKLNIVLFDISNNPIKSIPETFYKKKRINTLYLHNTNLPNIPEEIFELTNLHKLSFDDKHLSSIAHNIHLLSNIDSINLKESNHAKTSKIIQKLNLKFYIQKWIDKEDKSDRGNVLIFKENKENFNIEEHIKDLV